ncbi:MAG: hypothetical protein GX244_09880 [Firmicutes bacterium]|nr:hypothetical protein [Bacillota bacterium]
MPPWACAGEDAHRPAGFTHKLTALALRTLKAKGGFLLFGREELDARYRLLLGLLL